MCPAGNASANLCCAELGKGYCGVVRLMCGVKYSEKDSLFLE